MRHRQLELIPALVNLLWGLWVGNPYWQTFTTAGAFGLMAKLAPEWVWGMGVGLVGLFQLIVLFTNHLRWRQIAAMVATYTLVTLSVFYAFGNFRTTGVPTYSVLALCAWFGYTEILAALKGKL